MQHSDIKYKRPLRPAKNTDYANQVAQKYHVPARDVLATMEIVERQKQMTKLLLEKTRSRTI